MILFHFLLNFFLVLFSLNSTLIIINSIIFIILIPILILIEFIIISTNHFLLIKLLFKFILVITISQFKLNFIQLFIFLKFLHFKILIFEYYFNLTFILIKSFFRFNFFTLQFFFLQYLDFLIISYYHFFSPKKLIFILI